MTSFAIVSNWTGEVHAQLASITLDNRIRYAQRHGYLELSTAEPGHWGKIDALLGAWDKADWLWWLDIDAIITNSAIRLEELVLGGGEVVVTCDVNGLNSGSMLLRTSEQLKSFLEEMRSRRALFNAPPYYEQTALAHMLWRVKELVRVVEQRTMNSYPNAYQRDIPEERWQAGDFVLHCPGLEFAKRQQLLRDALNSSF